MLHFAGPGRPAPDWRWAQVQIPPPKSSPVPPPEGATPAAAAPQLPKAMAKALAKQRRDFARNKIRYAGCAYEHQGFTGEEFCQDWQVAAELDPVLAAHLLDQELFASGGALNLQVCSDSADFRWPLDVVFLNNLNTLETRPLLLRLLSARAAALLAQPSGPPTARVEALIANFLAVAQIPLCDGQAGPAAERPARLAACLTTWVRWTAVHAHEANIATPVGRISTRARRQARSLSMLAGGARKVQSKCSTRITRLRRKPASTTQSGAERHRRPAADTGLEISVAGQISGSAELR